MDFRCRWVCVRVIVALAVTGGALLVGACAGGGPASAPPMSAEDIKVKENRFGPDVELDDGFFEVEIWADIEAVDDRGIAIDAVKAGDTVSIRAISGQASFSGQPGAIKVLRSVIYSASAGLIRKPAAVKAAEDQVGIAKRRPEQGKERDGYGQDENGNYARNEGGVIVCMPAAGGPMYAHDRNHLRPGAESEGRLDKFLSPDMRGKCFFPTRDELGQERKVARDGILYVLAFDRDFKDNAGGYEVSLLIKRP